MNTSLLSQTRTNKKKYQYRAFIWLLPAFALMLVFSYIPPIMSFVLSFTNSDGQDIGKFILFDNYTAIFREKLFWTSLKNVLIFTACGLVFGNAANIILAELIFNLAGKKLAGLYRFLFVVPLLVPGIVGLLIWQRIIFEPSSTGLMNSFLGLFGVKPQLWYYSENTAMLSIILTGFPYGGGIPLLIYLAGLGGISTEMIEATRLEGLSPIKKIFYIDLPLMLGQLKYALITGIIGGFQNYNLQLLFTRGGPGMNGATMVPGYLIYDRAFMKDKYGSASAIGMFMFVITLALTVINMKVMKNKDLSEEVN